VEEYHNFSNRSNVW